MSVIGTRAQRGLDDSSFRVSFFSFWLILLRRGQFTNRFNGRGFFLPCVIGLFIETLIFLVFVLAIICINGKTTSWLLDRWWWRDQRSENPIETKPNRLFRCVSLYFHECLNISYFFDWLSVDAFVFSESNGLSDVIYNLDLWSSIKLLLPTYHGKVNEERWFFNWVRKGTICVAKFA